MRPAINAPYSVVVTAAAAVAAATEATGAVPEPPLFGGVDALRVRVHDNDDLLLTRLGHAGRGAR
jgi:hypothetical protein